MEKTGSSVLNCPEKGQKEFYPWLAWVNLQQSHFKWSHKSERAGVALVCCDLAQMQILASLLFNAICLWAHLPMPPGPLSSGEVSEDNGRGGEEVFWGVRGGEKLERGCAR